MTPTCIAADHPNATPAAAFPAICVSCWLKLPELTRHLYKHGGLKRPQFIRLARERVASLKVVRRSHG